MMPYQTILYETTESEYESSENGSVEIPAQSTSPNKTSKRKPVQWKLKNLFIDRNLINSQVLGNIGHPPLLFHKLQI